jgi:hypothetical protein
MNFNNQTKKSIKQKLINTVVLFVIFLVALIYFGIIYYVKSINTLKSQIIDEKINSEKKYQVEKNVIALNKKINEINSGVNSLSDVFVNKNRELELITALENIANKNTVTQKIDLATPAEKQVVKSSKKTKVSAETVPTDDILSSSLTISASGKYNNIINYLKEINALKYYINIDGLDLSQAISGDDLAENNSLDSRNINLNIIAKTYWK